jgi:hypothetical protein
MVIDFLHVCRQGNPLAVPGLEFTIAEQIPAMAEPELIISQLDLPWLTDSKLNLQGPVFMIGERFSDDKPLFHSFRMITVPFRHAILPLVDNPGCILFAPDDTFEDREPDPVTMSYPLQVQAERPITSIQPKLQPEIRKTCPACLPVIICNKFTRSVPVRLNPVQIIFDLLKDSSPTLLGQLSFLLWRESGYGGKSRHTA